MVSQQKLRVVGPVILTYHNNPLEQFFKTDCDLEISVRVNETRDRPECKQFGGFRAVTALHIGRNDEIIQTHARAIKWLNQQGYSVAGPISEEYIVSPMDIINDILVGVAKADGKYVTIPDRKEAIAYCMSIGQKGDIILLAGKGHEDYQEIKGVKHHMDERDLIEEIIAGK